MPTLLWYIATPGPIAYLDPGSGSMALQLLIAGGLSGLFFARSAIGAVRSWLGRFRPAR